jgi:hypothetical protein
LHQTKRIVYANKIVEKCKSFSIMDTFHYIKPETVDNFEKYLRTLLGQSFKAACEGGNISSFY